MKKHIFYNEHDLKMFFDIDEKEKSKKDSISLQKLLQVQNKISILQDIEKEDLEAITYKQRFQKFKFNDTIISTGDTNEDIYFIVQGKCAVLVKDQKVATLNSGDTFGEAAAIFKTKRNADIVCSSETCTILSFCIDLNNVDFCSSALLKTYVNLASQINSKLLQMNEQLTKQ